MYMKNDTCWNILQNPRFHNLQMLLHSSADELCHILEKKEVRALQSMHMNLEYCSCLKQREKCL